MRGVKLVRSPRHRVMLSFVRSPGSFPDCFDTFSPRRHHFRVQASEEESEEEEVKVQRRLGLFLRPSSSPVNPIRRGAGGFFTTPLLQERRTAAVDAEKRCTKGSVDLASYGFSVGRVGLVMLVVVVHGLLPEV